ncbi:hypothetical protein D3C71_1876980 [compost metagenome]
MGNGPAGKEEEGATSAAENAASVEMPEELPSAGPDVPPAAEGCPAAPATMAREPIPAQGTSAQKRPWADKGASGGCSNGAVMGRSF